VTEVTLKGPTKMAMIVHYDVKGMTEQKYATILRRLDAAGAGSPPGRLHHTCYGSKSALVVVDVFDTMQAFESFGKTLVPILTELGVEAKPDFKEVHNIIRGG
jgi:hypothetical protein